MGSISWASFPSWLWWNISRWDLSAFFAAGADPEDGMLWKVGGGGSCGRGACKQTNADEPSKNKAHLERKTATQRAPKASGASQRRESLWTTLSSPFSLPTLWSLKPKWATFLEGIEGRGWKKGLASSLMIRPFRSWQRVKSPFWVFLPGAPEF